MFPFVPFCFVQSFRSLHLNTLAFALDDQLINSHDLSPLLILSRHVSSLSSDSPHYGGPSVGEVADVRFDHSIPSLTFCPCDTRYACAVSSLTVFRISPLARLAL